MRRYSLILSVIVLGLASRADAHPVARDHHDRTIIVHLNPARDTRIEVLVEYRVEVDELTVLLDDMRPFRDEVDPALFRKQPLAYYAEFTRIYAPILAARLSARANGRELKFICVHRDQRLRDEKEEPLGHLRCDFVFRAEFLRKQENELGFDEMNYLDQPGKIDVSLGGTHGLRVLTKVQPDAALKNRAGIELKPGDDEKLRRLEVRFAAATQGSEQARHMPTLATTERKDAPARPDEHDESLLDLFRRTDVALWLLLLLAAGLGAVHALTPGHGKTLVAAYLIGERGTVWHAIVLGVVTTLTHTGIVLIIAAVLFFLPDNMSQSAKETLHAGLGLAMGLLVAALGVWLLLQRLAGRADHFHIGGGHHRHHPHDPSHAHTHSPGAGSSPGWYSLVVLGITGGIIPCWDAIALLVLTVGSSEFWLALPLLLAFSAGLAGVLVLIGILVVKTRGFLGSRWGEGRVVRALPLVSAVAITAIGVWLCYESVRGS